MPLRTRLAVIFLALLSVLTVLFTVIFVGLVGPGLARLEQAEGERDLRRVREALQRNVRDLDVLAGDWGDWDDTFGFVHDRNAAYIDSNLVPELFGQLRIHLLIILDRQGRAVWQRIVDPETGEALDLPELPAAGLAADHPLLRVAGHSEPLSGMLATARAPLLLAVRPIRNSGGSGPSAGTLMMGRFLAEAPLEDLARLTQLELSVASPEALTGTRPGLAGALTIERPMAFETLPEGGLRGYLLLSDLFGRPALVVSAPMRHDLADGARRTLLSALAAAAAVSLVLLAVMVVMTRHALLRPLARLTRHVNALDDPGNLAAGLDPRTRDEVGALADAFARLSDRLAAAAAERDRARAQLFDGVEGIVDGFALWDGDDRLVLCNPLFREYLPLIADLAVPGARFVDLTTAALERGQLQLDAVQAAHWVEERVRRHQTPGPPAELQLSDGRWLEIRESRTREGGIVGIYTDITARKRAEQQLRATVQELERSNTDLEQFAYVASHDLQEPLRQVASYVQLLERRYGGQLDDDAREFIRYAVSGSRRMQDQVNDLLAYARVNRQERPFATVDSSEALRTALANLHAVSTAAGARIEAAKLPAVRGDRALIVQLFQNLVANAVKYARDDVSPQITISAERLGVQWCFAVADNGIGIDEQYSERIFRIFQRLHPREKYDGTGIGLAICKRIVERHDGEIWVESAPGRGSTFFFTLPAAPVPSDLQPVDPA